MRGSLGLWGGSLGVGVGLWGVSLGECGGLWEGLLVYGAVLRGMGGFWGCHLPSLTPFPPQVTRCSPAVPGWWCPATLRPPTSPCGGALWSSSALPRGCESAGGKPGGGGGGAGGEGEVLGGPWGAEGGPGGGWWGLGRGPGTPPVTRGPSPTPTVRWQRLNGPLPRGRASLENFNKTLRLREVEEADDGEYECVAENSQGQARHSHLVTVEGRARDGGALGGTGVGAGGTGRQWDGS